MTGRFDNPFERLEPPPGGLDDLWARIARDERRGRRFPLRAGVWATACLLLIAATVTLLSLRGSGAPEPPEFRLARMRLGLIPSPREVVSVAESRRSTVALERVPLDTDTVVFYRVAFATSDETY